MLDTESDLEKRVVAWISGRKSGVKDIPPHFDLIENRVIDSLQFMDFLLFLESLTGREISLEQVTIDHFRTLASIRENFLNVVSKR